jgi:L-ascorbate metabolism protein UlaG (beta-lactamase superfamily)
VQPGRVLHLGTLALLVATLTAHATSPAPEHPDQPVDGEGRFVNLDGSRPQGLGAVFRWAVLDKLAGRRRHSPDRAPVARLEPDPERLAAPPAPGQPARLTWLGHASWLVQLDGVSLLIDPALGPALFGGKARNVEPGLRPEALPPIDAQLVTHSHYDHLDLPTLTAVGAPVIAGLGLERLFRASGLFCTELGWWQAARVGAVRITFVPAQHWSRRGLLDGNTTLWGGFVIQGRSATIYHSGDTAWFAGFAEIGRRFPGIDAALLPIGAYDPAWFMERQHLNPEQALAAFAALGAERFLAMHWGTFKLTDEPLDEPPRRLEAERLRLGVPAERVQALAVGETVEVGGRAERGGPAERTPGGEPPEAGGRPR